MSDNSGEWVEVDCPECRGTGRELLGLFTCSRCSGAKKIKVWRAPQPIYEPEVDENTCPHCHGTCMEPGMESRGGYESMCRECHGTGVRNN